MNILLAQKKLSTIMSFRTNDSVFTILLLGAVFYPWIFMMVLMVQVVEYISAIYLLAPLGWPTIMSLQNNDSVFTIMEIVALSFICFALSLSLFQVSDIQLH